MYSVSISYGQQSLGASIMRQLSASLHFVEQNRIWQICDQELMHFVQTCGRRGMRSPSVHQVYVAKGRPIFSLMYPRASRTYSFIMISHMRQVKFMIESGLQAYLFILISSSYKLQRDRGVVVFDRVILGVCISAPLFQSTEIRWGLTSLEVFLILRIHGAVILFNAEGL